jgi:hypothetical protein
MILHPLDQMTSFPFIPVRVHREKVVGGEIIPIVSVYEPHNFFVDHPVVSSSPPQDVTIDILAPGDPDTVLVIPRLEEAPELWELPMLSRPLQDAIMAGTRLRDVAAQQARNARRAIVAARVQMRRAQNAQFLPVLREDRLKRF